MREYEHLDYHSWEYKNKKKYTVIPLEADSDFKIPKKNIQRTTRNHNKSSDCKELLSRRGIYYLQLLK